MSVPGDDDFLDDHANRLLTFCAAIAWPGGAFTRVYNSAGAPAWDCSDQLAVWSRGIRSSTRPTTTGAGPLRCSHIPILDLSVAILRCVTAVSESDVIPSATVLNDEGRLHNRDGWVLWREVTRGILAGTVFTDITCGSIKVNPQLPLGPQGGLAGWQLDLEVGIA